MSEMKLLIETAIIFFGTLLAAALLALGDPGSLVPSIFQGESAHSTPAPGVAVTEWTSASRPAPSAH
jgi:hypothetical protein